MTNDFAWDNPFNCEAWFEDIDPMFAKTAEDVDRAGFVFLPEVTDLDTYAEAHLVSVYQNAIRDAIENGHVPLNRTTAEVPHPTAARMTSCWIKRLESTRKDQEEAGSGVFNIDAVVVAEIDIFQPENINARRARLGAYQALLESGASFRTGHVRQWYRIRGYLDLIGNNTELVQSIMIYDKKDKRKERGLSDCLIPIIPKTDMEQEAERLLQKNKMGYAVDRSCRVEAMKLAHNMGLMVKDVRLSLGHRIRGELYLHDATVKYYKDDGTEDYMEVKAGTILYDSVACDTQERIEETIVHECIHYEEHFLFYKLQREYNNSIAYLACVDPRYADDSPEDAYEQWLEDESTGEPGYHDAADTKKERTDIEWAEWQARELTPRVKMPGTQTKEKIESLILWYSRYPHNSLAELYARIIPELARFYGVSWTMAKIRMIELGYEEARGARNFVDGSYVPPYTTSTGRIDPGTSYDISIDDARRLYETDPVFKAISEEGMFVYAESHYCLDDPRFIWKDGNGYHLTDEARKSIDRCCILFVVSRRNRGSRYDKEALHNDDWKNDPIAVALAALPIEAHLNPAAYKAKLVAGLPASFGETLKHHREKEGLTQEQLAELLGVNRVTVGRYETSKKPPITKQMIARIGVEFHLRGEYTDDMMDKAGLSLDTNDEKDNNLKHVIYYMYMLPVELGDRFLAEHDCLPLGGRKGATE